MAQRHRTGSFGFVIFAFHLAQESDGDADIGLCPSRAEPGIVLAVGNRIESFVGGIDKPLHHG